MTDLKSGTKLNVLIESDKEDNKTIVLSSSLEAFGDNKRLLITAPTLGELHYPVGINQQITIQFYDKSAVIAFDALVLQRIARGTLAYLLLEQKSEFRRTQRRQDFRMECLLDGQIEFLDPESNVVKKIKVVANDLSGGGVSVRCSQPFQQGERITIYLPLGDKGDIIRYSCEVRRCFQNEDSTAAFRYNLGLQFLFDTSKQKDALIARIFKMERERRKKASSN